MSRLVTSIAALSESIGDFRDRRYAFGEELLDIPPLTKRLFRGSKMAMVFGNTPHLALLSKERLGIMAICLALVASVTPLYGCGTTIKSRRVAADAEPGREFGIIYQMTKPQFTITTTQPSTAAPVPKYTLQYELVPDLERRFAITVEPGFLREADLTVNLGANGSLTGVSQASREQVTPTIKAISDFVTAIVGGATTVSRKGALLSVDEEAAIAKAEATELSDRIDEYQKLDDRVSLTPGLRNEIPTLPKPNTQERDELNKRLLGDAGEIKKRIEDQSPVTEGKLAVAVQPQLPSFQRYVLWAIADTSRISEQRRVQAKKAYDLAQNLLKAAAGELQPPDTSPPDAIKREWEIVVAEVGYAVDREDLATLEGFRTRELSENSTKGLDEKWLQYLQAHTVDLVNKAFKEALTIATFPRLLGPYARERTAAQRIYDAVKREQGMITEFQAQLANEGEEKARMKLQVGLIESTRRLHNLIDATSEYEETVKLRKLITEGPPSPQQAGHGSPLSEYASARTQVAALQEVATLKLAKVIADGADNPAQKPPLWDPPAPEPSFVWNIQREAMEKRLGPPRRLLVAKGKAKSEPGPVERVADRAREQYGLNLKDLPKFIIVIEAVKP